MIVRISGEGQYELDDALHDELNRLDDATVAAVEAGDEAGYRAAFDALLDAIRTRGRALAGDELAESALIVPPADLSLQEAAAPFSGDGLIPNT